MKVKTGWVARDEDGGLKLHWELLENDRFCTETDDPDY